MTITSDAASPSTPEIETLRQRVLELERQQEDRRKTDQFQEGQRRFFEQLLTGEPIEQALDTLVRAVELRTEGARCSILLLDELGKHLLNGAAPSLPSEYNKAIHGLAIGPTVGSCGTAAALNRTVIVTDIAVDPLWAPFKDLALSHGLRACWSVPFQGAGGAVLGTFAFYYGEPRAPSPSEIEQIHEVAHLASIAVERWRTERALKRSEARMRTLVENAALLLFSLDSQGNFTFAGGRRLSEALPSPAEMVGRSAFELFRAHPAILDDTRHALEGEAIEVLQVLPDAVLQTCYTPLRAGEAEDLTVVGISIDVTARHHAQEEAKKLHEKVIAMQAAAINELSTPLIPISDQVLVMPLIGRLDARRAETALSALLSGVSKNQARCVIVDITGMTSVDAAVADALVRTARAVRLLGAEVILTGMRPETARAMIELGVDLGSLVTRGSLQQGIAHAVRR